VPWPVYSETFVRTTVRDAWVVYTVPSGMRAVVKTIAAVSTSTSIATVTVEVGGVYMTSRAFQASGADFVINTMAVAYSGQLVRALTQGGLAHVSISGFLFGSAGAVQEDPPPTLQVPQDPAVIMPFG
jgi:hypothetical protein